MNENEQKVVGWEHIKKFYCECMSKFLSFYLFAVTVDQPGEASMTSIFKVGA